MRGLGGVLQLTQQSLNVCRNLRSPDDLGPELQRRGSGQFGQKAYDAEIVVEMRASATVISVARQPDPGPALLPRAGAPEVLAPRIGQENVCAAPCTLEPALEPARQDCELRQIGHIIDGDEQVHILGIGLLSQNRAEQCDAAHSGQSAGLPNEAAPALAV
jgi:hypothetical protein